MVRGTGQAGRLAYEPDYAVPPGATLLETIQALGIDQKEFARRTGYTEKHISHVIQAKAGITPEAALRFEKVTQVPARFWNNLETQYREQLARLESRHQAGSQLDWLKQIPVQELVSRKEIPPCATKVELLEAALVFFGVASVAAWRIGWTKHQIAFRRSATIPGVDGAIAAWVRMAERQAQQVACEAFDEARFRAALKEIRELTVNTPAEFVPQMKRLCGACGVAVVFVPEIPKAPVNGATRWLNKTRAMIAVNLRGKSNDRFWFTFFHEAGHVLNDDRTQVFVDVSNYVDDPREKAADEFAAGLLIPPRYMGRLATLKSRVQVQRFAAELRIHPGIVVGRLQHEGILPRTHLNGLKAKLVWASG